ncbi:MAG: hypothetical protein ACFCAD_18125 [Pleurocapsa sp.]
MKIFLKLLVLKLHKVKIQELRVFLNGIKAVFHEPHPERETDKGAGKSVKEFLINTGIEPNDY